MMKASSFGNLFLFLTLDFPLLSAKIPDAEIFVDGVLYRGSYGNFGSRSNFQNLILQEPPQDDILMCSKETVTTKTYNRRVILLVPRGVCSFESKMIRAQSMGALGVIIYNTLESRYKGNATNFFPEDKIDYECQNGKTVIENLPFDLDPPSYDGSVNDPYMLTDNQNTICKFNSNSRKCESKRCLLANRNSDGLYTACCAWDIHIQMSKDRNFNKTEVSNSIAIFVTMTQSEELMKLIGATLSIQARFYPHFNISSILLWLLATLITALASWYSAKDYRRANFKLTNPQRGRVLELPERTPIAEIQIGNENQEDLDESIFPLEESVVDSVLEDGEATSQPTTQNGERSGEGSNESSLLGSNSSLVRIHGPTSSVQSETSTTGEETEGNTLESTRQSEAQTQVTPIPPLRPPSQQPTSQIRNTRFTYSQTEALTLNMFHVVFFILFASTLLLLLFYLQFYDVVTVLYGIGCSGCISQLVFRPIYIRSPRWERLPIETALFPKITFLGISNVTLLDIFAGLSGYAMGALWLTIWFTSNYPSRNVFYWIMQDVMGACISIVFLDLLRLNSIKVATVLLISVFLYDIFFVFISPLFFDGDSIMVTVATSGGAGNVTVDYCEKYPDDSRCGEGQPLPMLLNIPRVGDFRGGASYLGLGDVVLPGLLISFTSRLDEAKRLVGTHTNMLVQYSPHGGYTLWLIAAYAIGLLIANSAVVLMQQAQPALLYIVPTIICTLVLVGWKEFWELWKGPSIFTLADRLVRYCDHHDFFARDFVTVAESIDEDIENEGGPVRVTELNDVRELT